MKFLKAISLLCSFVLLFSLLSACGKGDNSATGSGDDNNSSNKTSGSTPIVPEIVTGTFAELYDSEKGKTIKLAVWEDMNKTEARVPLSKIETDIGLKYEQLIIPKAKYVDTLKTLVATGQSPDVFMSDSGEVGFPLTMQIAAPINKVSTVDLEEPILDQSFLQYTTIEGNVYLVNTLNSPLSRSKVLFYHKELFLNNGFKTPAEYYEEGDWTLQTLEKVLHDIKLLGPDYNGGYIDFSSIAASCNGTLAKYDFKTSTFSNAIFDPNLNSAFEWYSAIKNAGLLNGSIEGFKSGKTGIIVADTDSLKVSGLFKNMDPESIGFTFLPSMQDGKNAPIASDFVGFGIVKNAPYANAAGYFIRYIVDYRNYDLQNAFLTPEAGNFYYKLINEISHNKCFNFDDSLIAISDKYKDFDDFFDKFRSHHQASPNPSLTDPHLEAVDEFISKGNEIIANLKEENAK